MTPVELTSFVTAIANIVARDLSEDELGLLAAMLTQLADTLATIALLKGLSTDDSDSFPAGQRESGSRSENLRPGL